MTEPLIIQQANREAVITGSKVQLYHVKPRNKKKPLRISEWPETDVVDKLKAFDIGFLWVLKGFIDDDLVRH